MADDPQIVITDTPLPRPQLAQLVAHWFRDMVKVVVDVRRGVIAVGGELHADAEALLLEAGSAQDDLWGANYYPGRTEFLEFTALINIRPAQGNPGMEIGDEGVRAAVRDLVERVLGRGEPL